MTRITESAVEQLAIEELEQRGYSYLYGPDIAPDGEQALRGSFEEVLLLDKVRAAIARLNPSVPSAAREDALRQLQRAHAPNLIAADEAFHRMLTEGITVNYSKSGVTRGDLVWLIDFEHSANNEFNVVNQFTVVENRINKRPDVVLFVNGLPLVVMEIKNPADENATVYSAFKQLQTYKELIPTLLQYNELLVISDGLEAKMGSLSADYSRFMAWKSVDGVREESPLVSQIETLIRGMLNKETLLDLIQYFAVFEKEKKEDLKRGTTSIETVKKIAGYHQYYAVNRAVKSALRASGYMTKSHAIGESPAKYGLPSVEQQPVGDHKGGVMWHTQGSGKSLSMVFFTGKIVRLLNNPTVVVITDRNDLDNQLFETFAASKQLIRQEPVQAENREHLKTLLRVASGGVVFSTIQKFQPDNGNAYDELSERENIIVIADEAHRSQYGFSARTVEVKDAEGNVTGSQIVYWLAKYLRDALPKATFMGFTGTPIERNDINTPAVFGNYIDIYDIAQSVEDGATVKIFYESRLAKIGLSPEGKKLVEALDAELESEDLTENQQAKAKWTKLEALVGSEKRIQRIALDIVEHFEKRQEVFKGKAMIVTMSRRIAAELFEAIAAIRPEWQHADLDKGKMKVVMTAASSDGPMMAKHHTNKSQRRGLAERMKNPDDELQIAIVCDMWLTGFDVPCLHTMYLDKPMKGHTLMQAIARVNRVYGDKPGGLIVDYLGIAADLKKALSFYSDSGGKGDPALLQERAADKMEEKLEIVTQLLHGFAYHEYFTANTSRKLAVILEGEDFILGLENGKKRFLDEVTALSQAFAMAVPLERAMAVKDEVAFFQAIKARLSKFNTSGNGRSNEEIETVIRQVIDQALVSDQVVDVFDAAGIKRPDISILSDEFLFEIQHMEHQNIALETLRKLLGDEIKARLRKNLVQSKKLVEMLEDAIKRYHNKIITAAEVIEELIRISKDIQEMDKEPAEMGLTDYEYAFYTAVANNDSARELMQVSQLRELAVVLTEKVRNNASIDWTIKESARAKLRVIVKRTLRKYGYPPDMEKLATETVLKQAELIADELVNS